MQNESIVALNRKNALFVGSDQGGVHWGVIASLIETCKLNTVDPQAYLVDVLTRLVNRHPASQVDDLMPWAYAQSQNTAYLAATAPTFLLGRSNSELTDRDPCHRSIEPREWLSAVPRKPPRPRVRSCHGSCRGRSVVIRGGGRRTPPWRRSSRSVTAPKPGRRQ